MFFFLSKVLYFFIQPINWLIGLLLFSCFTKNQKYRKIALAVTAAITLLFTNPFLFNQLIGAWELKTDPPEAIISNYDYGIVLGGYSNPNAQMSNGSERFSMESNRLLSAVQLYRKGHIKKFLMTSGPRNLGETLSPELQQAKGFLLQIGVPEEDIVLLLNSRNTHEHAVEVKKYLQKNHPNAQCILMTSGWHLRRALGCFEKSGVQTTPLTVETIANQEKGIRSWLLPDSLGFYKWEFFIKEVVGYFAYAAQGYL